MGVISSYVVRLLECRVKGNKEYKRVIELCEEYKNIKEFDERFM